jgi:hypothetical protein
MANYQKGKIYKLINSVNEIAYVGSTTRSLAKRMGEHRYLAGFGPSALYVSMRELGIANFKIQLIVDFPCTNRKNLETEEYRVMKEFTDDGISLYNTERDQFILNQETKVKLRKVKERFGSLNFTSNTSVWCYRWMVDGKKNSKSYSENKWGVAARQKLEALRLEIYPEYVDETLLHLQEVVSSEPTEESE